MLNFYHLPSLRVVVDSGIDEDVAVHLQRIGCKVYPVSLAERLLTSEDVLQITENDNGFDITSRATIDSNETKYYDWLTYEILNLHPKWIFVPVGTGDLYGNIARIIFDSLVSVAEHSYGRLQAAKTDLQGISLMGATTTDPSSFLDKLYAPFTPELERVKAYVADRKDYFSSHSAIYEVDD